ncbi:DUF3102 domain-containing protein [Desulfitobacterium chlororespirans]|uniref:DUF3102 domain-containing protein n=1 Tax=Desulfitobacterium chlororespirans DSM 11544 TaxID=1121395 RepID=A0A1M7UYY9_9FIRM|nr:DUF3102 domain-containing protein [Desulfitobacterium chlororespirans]SHN88136.1 Protein of unknown function [Desulfitobacterium chlororespirans DSM 11544]
MLLKNAIEVGRLLQEAKELLNHGEWLKWLKESVSFSKSTAANLMNLYKAYGPKLLSLADDDPNSQALGNLTYTKAVLLLGLPEEEREAFIAQHDLGSMTTRQLSQAVKEQRALAPPLVTNYEKKYTVCCQTITGAFQELLNALDQLARLDPQTKEKCSQDAGQLASYMVEQLKDQPPVAGINTKGIQIYSTYEW